MKQINKLKSALLGQPPIYLANNGRETEQVVIRYKEFFLYVDFDVESGEPTGEFGWSHEPMTHTPIREFYTATREHTDG